MKQKGGAGVEDGFGSDGGGLEEFIMRMNRFIVLGLIAVAAATIPQPTDQWSRLLVPGDVAGRIAPAWRERSPVAITNSLGKTIGYSCYVSGTFVVWARRGRRVEQLDAPWVRPRRPPSAPLTIRSTTRVETT